MTAENSPSNVAANATPLSHFISAETVVSAASGAAAAPFTTKLAPGSAWNVAEAALLGLKSCAQAARPRSVSRASFTAKDLSLRNPSSVRGAVTFFAR